MTESKIYLKQERKKAFIFPRSNDSMSEDVFSQHLEILDGESVDVLQGIDTEYHQGYPELSTNSPLDFNCQQSRYQYYDSGDSDDYAESDNWTGMGKPNVNLGKRKQRKGEIDFFLEAIQ